MIKFKHNTPRRRQQGYSLLELMIASSLGVVLIFGMISFFSEVSKADRVQSGLARLQENGRFAVLRMASDLRMAGAQYCAATTATFPDQFGQTEPRPLDIWVNPLPSFPVPSAAADTPPDLGAGSKWPLDPRYFLMGHECAASGACTPGTDVPGADTVEVPAPGSADGNRSFQSDVLTIRYLSGNGVTIGTDTNGVAPVILALGVNPQLSPLFFAPGDLALISDCSTTDVFATTVAGNTLTHVSADGNVADVTLDYERGSDSRVYNFTKGLRTISYFLAIKDDPNSAGRQISSLFRQINGVAEELIEGVERLDFMYSVEDGAGGFFLLNATQVDNRNGASIACPPGPLGIATVNPGCLWGAVKTIEVSMLLNTVEDNAVLSNEPFFYSVDSNTAQDPSSGLPSTLPPGRMMRKEFNFSVSVRNHNI